MQQERQPVSAPPLSIWVIAPEPIEVKDPAGLSERLCRLREAGRYGDFVRTLSWWP